MMTNQTSEFILLGLLDLKYSQIPLSLLILFVYVSTLVGNLLIISLVVSDSRLQTPMYFFLGNLSALDIFTSSVSSIHLLFDIFRRSWLILYSSCIAQVFFFFCFGVTEAFLLAVMSYDRYVAICHPLHYTTMINVHLCLRLAFGVWVIGSVCSSVHTICTLRLAFCGSTTIPGLFCELYQLIQLACSDTSLNNLLMYLHVVCFGIAAFLITFLSYVYVFKTILRIKVKDGKLKAFSTCSSHLTVVFIFYGTVIFNYVWPTKKGFLEVRIVSAVYAILTPFLNPAIYSLRNNEVKGAFCRALARVGFRP
ncbi:olfactory receptor 5B12-like [Lithobates pipiens]